MQEGDGLDSPLRSSSSRVVLMPKNLIRKNVSVYVCGECVQCDVKDCQHSPSERSETALKGVVLRLCSSLPVWRYNYFGIVYVLGNEIYKA